MTRPEIADLFASLDAIESCCEDGDWESAAARLTVHDREVRALSLQPEDVPDLQALHARQLALQQRMVELRDATADELQKFAASRRGAARYLR